MSLPNEMNAERADVLRAKIRELSARRELYASQVRVVTRMIDAKASELADIERGNALERIRQDRIQEHDENWNRSTL